MKYFSWFIILVVAAAIIAGFFVAGSPQKQRAMRFDDNRISNLQQIQYNITDYYQNKQALPPNLAALNDPVRNVIIPTDPETKQDYEYYIRNSLTFELCATFSEASAAGIDQQYPMSISGPNYFGPNATWAHPAGHYCFDRTIDPAYFKPAGATPPYAPVIK